MAGVCLRAEKASSFVLRSSLVISGDEATTQLTEPIRR